MRHREVLHRLREHGPQTVDQLAAALAVSAATVRRDLAALESTGTISRVHGGAVLRPGAASDADVLRPFAQVAGDDAEDKALIAKRAAELVDDGETVILDVGTTTMHLAQALRGRTLTVVTANLAVVDVLRDEPSIDLIVLGGQVRRAYHSLVGSLTLDTLRQVRASTVFLGASGVQPDGSVFDTTAAEVPIKRALLRAAERTVLVADRHKFPGSGALRVCAVGELDALVTNLGADQETLAAARAAGVEVICA